MPFSHHTESQHERTREAGPALSRDTISRVTKRTKRFLSNLLVPLRVRDFRLLFGGQLISNIGDMFYTVAMPWFILSSGGGAQSLSVVLVAYGLPRAASPLLGGMLSDRLRPRRVMLLADSLRALLVGALAWLAFVGHPSLWLLCLIMALLGTCAGLFLPASFSMMPDILPEADLPAGNSLGGTSTQLAILVGPALAGLIVSHFQPAVGLVLDAFSFVISAITLLLIHSSRTPGRLQRIPPGEHGERFANLTQEDSPLDESPPALTFWQLLRTSRFLRLLLVILVLSNFFGGAVSGVALPAFAHDRLKAGASGYSLIIAAFGIGALIGGVGASGLGRLSRRGMVVLLIWLLQSIAITLIPFAGIAFGVGGSALVSGVEGLTNSLGNITFRTIVQQHFPRNLLGRINGAFFFCEFSLYPLSVALAGVMVLHRGPLSVFLVNGALGLLCMIYSISQRELREM
ncbi:MAG: MFS transporter [Chloroflexota bacterium]|nr:MFS transporter [Chloroflexota bacterium]